MPGFVIASGMMRWSMSMKVTATSAARSSAACAPANAAVVGTRSAASTNSAAVSASTSG